MAAHTSARRSRRLISLVVLLLILSLAAGIVSASPQAPAASDVTAGKETPSPLPPPGADAKPAIPFPMPAAGVGPAAPPPHDDISQAIVVSGTPFYANAETAEATVASDDPALGCGGAGGNGHTVWYRYSGSGSAQVRIDTSGSTYDTVLAVLVGEPGSLREVACSDDSAGLGYNSRVEFFTTPGIAYYVEVASFGTGPGGHLQLNLRYPANEYRVLSGPVPYTDSASKVWAAEQPFSDGGWGYVNGNGGAYTGDAIAGTADDGVYQWEHVWTGNGAPGYRFTVPNGRYQVTLKFAEIWHVEPAYRVFDVRIEGRTALANFDIFAAAGAHDKKVDKAFVVDVVDDEVTIDFVKGPGSIDWPKVSAIEVKPVFSLRMLPGYAHRLPAATGYTYLPDQPYAQGAWGYAGNDSAPLATLLPISGVQEDALYQRWREEMTGYNVALPNGVYRVILGFSENRYRAAGRRVFDVSLEGSVVLSNFDIFAAAGNKAYKVVDKALTVQVTDGVLNIGFVRKGSDGWPQLNSLTVLWLSKPGTAGPAGAEEPAADEPAAVELAENEAALQTAPSLAAAGPAAAVEYQVNAGNGDGADTAGNVWMVDYRVNAGGGVYTDTSGNVWAADQVFSAGSWGYESGNAIATSAAIAGTEDDLLYQSVRYAYPLIYRFSAPADRYQVTLKFAGILYDDARAQVFDVRIEGRTVLSGYDPCAAAGAANKRAPDQVFLTDVLDGEVTIEFLIAAGDAGVPAVNAIAVKPVYGLRVDTAGAGGVDPAGFDWAADQPYGASWGYMGASSTMTTTSEGIFGTGADWLYQSSREKIGAYRFNVPSGTYSVTLGFAENRYNAAGRRLFSVKLEDSVVLTNFDIFAAAGNQRYKVVDRSFLVTVNDGVLNVIFTGVAGKAPPIVSTLKVMRQSTMP